MTVYVYKVIRHMLTKGKRMIWLLEGTLSKLVKLSCQCVSVSCCLWPCLGDDDLTGNRGRSRQCQTVIQRESYSWYIRFKYMSWD